MNALMSKISSWYDSREPREQRVLLIGGVAILAILLLGLLMPLHKQVGQARLRLEKKQTDLAWMREVAPRLATFGPAPVAPTGNESLVVLVDRSAREAGLGEAMTGSQPNGKDGLRITFTKAEFNSLIAWLARLTGQHGLKVDTATTDSTDEPGRVNATIQIRTAS